MCVKLHEFHSYNFERMKVKADEGIFKYKISSAAMLEFIWNRY